MVWRPIGKEALHLEDWQRHTDDPLIKELMRPGQKFRDCEVCPEMVVVPAGSTVIGSTADEQEWIKEQGHQRGPYGTLWGSQELPRHEVTFLQPFAVGRYEVTVREFAAFVRESGYSAGLGCVLISRDPGRKGEETKMAERTGSSWRNPGYPQTDSHPVTCVNWYDAIAYLVWLSREAGHEYRLLSEAEWEYAARGGTTTYRYWGNDEDNKIGCQYANVADLTAADAFDFEHLRKNIFICHDGYATTAPVGRFRANAFDLYDMLGNVQEWVQDCWRTHYVGAPTDGSAWTVGDCSIRGVRGGAWHRVPDGERSANRDGAFATDRVDDRGFRVARTLP